MKKVILTLVVLFIIQSAFTQPQNLGNWMVTVNTGLEAHDKRLFNYGGSFDDFLRSRLLAKSPEYWGTYHSGLGVKKKVRQKKRMSIFMGLGISYENATFTRPFDNGHFVTITAGVIEILNRYKKVLTPISFSAYYELGDHWFISGELVSNFLVFRSIRNTEWSREGFSYIESTFEWDDIQLRLGLNGRIGRVIIGIYSRVVNFQKIDKTVFNDIIRDPRTDQKWEWYNPLRFDLTVGYTW